MIALFRPKVVERVVGAGDSLVSTAASERLITHALGSCIGIVMHDPVAVVAGLLHAQLPTRDMHASTAAASVSAYVDTGVAALLRACTKRGADPSRLVVSVAGGAQRRVVSGDRFIDGAYHIGQRNLDVLASLLGRLGLAVHAADTGGTGISRTMWVDVGSGAVALQSNGVTSPLRPLRR